MAPIQPCERVAATPDNTPLKDRRLPFDANDLIRIFSAPLYTGCVNDERGYAKFGIERPRRARYWVPLIALYSGMRLNEICQLTLDDIAFVDGVDVILIRGDEDKETKRVKNAAGHRFVPDRLPALEKLPLNMQLDNILLQAFEV